MLYYCGIFPISGGTFLVDCGIFVFGEDITLRMRQISVLEKKHSRFELFGGGLPTNATTIELLQIVMIPQYSNLQALSDCNGNEGI